MIVKLHTEIQGIRCTNSSDMGSLLRVYGDFHHLRVDDQSTMDWLEAYGLVNGKRLSILLPDDPTPVNYPTLRVTFPELDMSLL